MIDSNNAKDFERAFKSHSKPLEHGEEGFLKDQAGNSKSSLSEKPPNPFESTSSSEEMQKP